MIDLTIQPDRRKRAIQRARERNIIIPTYKQMKNPALIPDKVKAVADELVNPDERIVVLVTGNGLKDVASARKSVGEPFTVNKDLNDVKRVASQL